MATRPTISAVVKTDEKTTSKTTGRPTITAIASKYVAPTPTGGPQIKSTLDTSVFQRAVAANQATKPVATPSVLPIQQTQAGQIADKAATAKVAINRPLIAEKKALEATQVKTPTFVRPTIEKTMQNKTVQNKIDALSNKISPSQKTSIESTIAKIGTDLGTGFLGITEGIADAVLLATAYGAKKLGAKEYSELLQRSAQMSMTQDITEPAQELYGQESAIKRGSIGETITQAIGGIGALGSVGKALGAAGSVGLVPTTPIISGLGAGAVRGLDKGKSLETSLLYGLGTGTLEGVTEALSGGIGGVFGKGAVDDILINKLANKFTSDLNKKLVTLGVKAGFEGLEENIAGLIDPYIQRLTIDEKAKLYSGDQAVMDFLVGAAASAILQAPGINQIDTTQETKQKTVKPTIEKPIAQTQVLEQEVAEPKAPDNIIKGKPMEIENQEPTEMAETMQGDDVLEVELKDSKVKDNKGQPIKTYHATDAEFNNFDIQKAGTKGDPGIWGRGIYFSNNNTTGIYGKNLHEAYLNIKNPLILSEFKTTKEIADYLDIVESNFRIDENGLPRISGNQVGQLSSQAKEKGHDGIIVDFPNSKFKEYVVFEPNQIIQTKINKQAELSESIKNREKTIYNEKIQQELKAKPTEAKLTKKEIDKQVENGKFDIEQAKELRKNPEAIKDIVAFRKTKSGKVVPAIRKSGVYAPKVFETTVFKDIKGKGLTDNLLSIAGTVDNVTAEQAAKDGFGPMKQQVYEIDKRIANKQTFVLETGNKIQSLAKKHGIQINKKSGETLGRALEGEETNPKMKAFAKDIRKILDELRDNANVERVALGKSEIGYIKNYFSHMKKTGFMRNLMADARTEIAENLDFIIPNAKKNPHAIQRTDADFDYEKNAWKVLDSYIGAISDDIYTSRSIEELKAINSVIAEKTPNASNFINKYIRENLVGKSAAMDNYFGINEGSKTKAVMTEVMKARTISALGANIKWMLFTQPASMANTIARTGVASTTKGFKAYLTDKSMQDKVNKLPSMMIKTKGSSVGKTYGGDINSTSAKLNTTKIDKFNDFVSIPADVMERILTGASAAAGFIEGQKIGLTGVELDMFADTIAQNTQSMYNKEARPMLMNNTVMRFGVPFQTFSFEMWRYAKQLTGKGGGIPIQKSKRMAQIIRLLISMALYGKYVEETTGQELSSVGTFIPIVGSAVDLGINQVAQTVGAVPREYSSTGRSPVAPFGDAQSMWDAIDGVVQYNNWQPMRKEMIKWGTGFAGISGASTVNRAVDGMIASSQGFQKTRSGKIAFPVMGTSEKIKAITMGPYSTEAGKGYINDETSYLTEKQSETVRSSSDPKAAYDLIINTREYNALIKEYKEAQAAGKSTTSIEKKIKEVLSK